MPWPVGEVACSADGVSCRVSTDSLGCRPVSLGSKSFHPSLREPKEAIDDFRRRRLGEDHHDVHLMDDVDRRLSSRRLPDGLAGSRELHELVAARPEETGQVVVGIETDHGLRVQALTAGRIPGIRGQPARGRSSSDSRRSLE